MVVVWMVLVLTGSVWIVLVSGRNLDGSGIDGFCMDCAGQWA